MEQKAKRVLSVFLALVCFSALLFPLSYSGFFVSQAATFRGKNIWINGPEVIYGRNRNWMYKWTDGWQMTFCIAPRNHMGNTITAEARRININDDNIPYIKSKEDYEKLAMICNWYDTNGSIYADNATYAAAQAAIWAIMEDGWESADSVAGLVSRHVPGTYEKWEELKNYVENTDDGGSPLPEWCSASKASGKPQQMVLENGVWTASVDVSSVPQLATLNWTFEGDSTGWGKSVSDGIMTFTYSGNPGQTMTVSADLPADLAGFAKNTTSLNLYIPKGDRSKIQAMISAGPFDAKIYVHLAFGPDTDSPQLDIPQVPDVTVYRHSETFESHYNFDVKKYCAETGKELKGAVFRILEAFEEGQAGGLLTLEQMEPRPAAWTGFKICGETATDEDGYFAHSDEKKYEYSKTYCDGHPEPEYLEAPEVPEDETEDDGDGTGESGDEARAIEEINDMVREQWEALVEACEAETDFHGMEPGEGLEMMLEDRDETYEQFINLEYDYTVQEIQARYGYIRHGLHSDDERIPVVRMNSSEAGAGSQIIEKEVIINYDAGFETEEYETDEYISLSHEMEIPEAKMDAKDRGVPKIRTAVRIPAIREYVKTATENNARRFIRAVPVPVEADDDGRETGDDGRETGDDGRETGDDGRETGDDGRETGEDGWETGENSWETEENGWETTGDDWETDDDDWEAGEGGTLREPEEDDVPWIEPAGPPDRNGYTFSIYNHRTEGELHINKRDMELQKGESQGYDSDGDTQGDGTLEGAVYGLYAAEDIIHPDGKTGMVYGKGELTAIATTDQKGDAFFLAYTEESEASKVAENREKTWVGHPLILGQYYVKEIARSEGYELSVYGADRQVSNLHTDREEISVPGKADVVTAMAHPIDMHDGSWLEFDVTYEGTAQGFDILVSGFPEGTRFYRSGMKETTGTEQVVTGSRLVETGEYEKAEEGEYRLDEEGNYIPVTDGDGNIIWDTGNPVSRVYRVTRRLNYYPNKTAQPQVDPDKWADLGPADPDYVAEEANSMLEQTGYQLLDSETGQDAPWDILDLSGTTNQELIEEILNYVWSQSFWDSGAVHKVWQEGGRYRAAVFHDYRRLSGMCIYEPASGLVYVKVPVQVAGMGERHTFLPYKKGDLAMAGGYISVPLMEQVPEEIPFLADIEDYLKPVYMPKYEKYRAGDYRLDGKGERIPVYRREFIYEEKPETSSDYELEPLESSYDSLTKAYTIHVDNRVDWNTADHSVTETFRAAAGQTDITVNGENMFYSDYLTDISGAGASAFVKWEDKEGSYIQPAYLTYPGQISPMQDGKGMPGEGTRKYPVSLQERIIKQTVKVTKDVMAVGDTADGKESFAMDNFRFKIYLKSNLQRLYRDEEGQITWTDRWGNEVDVETFKKEYPATVQALYTRPGGTALLETWKVKMEDGDRLKTIETYNYEKFFDAIRTANHDKWDDGQPSYTSCRPVGNEKNRTEYAIENTKISDGIRQFSINWYLDEEVEKLLETMDLAYGDQLYDQALFRAAERANDYLKPFFTYDLDEIYAICWDSEPDGGRDRDKTTVSADTEDGKHCGGISSYLPYGTYIIAEQQPMYADLKDLPNRHYRIDRPKEIALPSVYTDYEGACQYPEEMSGYYVYDSKMTPEKMTENYLIRFCQESRSVKVHNHSGDFVVYPYGLDTDQKREEGTNYSVSENAGTADDVRFYGGTATEENPSGMYYRDQVPVMTGVKTAYDGLYSPILVPWSMAVPEDERQDSQPEPSGESSYQGYAYARFRDLSYGAKLRIEKLDAETHENLLHDGAVFRIYAAARDDSEKGTGEVKFYNKDTMISGSREFLEAMGASYITTMSRGNIVTSFLNRKGKEKDDSKGPGNLYTGLVPEGTPVCKEEDQIFMPNTYGTRIGEFQAFTTTGNYSLEGTYGDQNAGYLETPRPLEAGTYVLAEVKAPAGYTRTKPVAIEIYSDKVAYYKEGDRQEHVLAAIHDKLTEYPSKNQNKPQDMEDVARIYVENAPVKLKIEKRKEASKGEANTTKDQTVTWQISGRIDGSLAQIGNNPDYEYAFLNEEYQGYGWKKGTLEYLQALKERGEDVAIVYHGTLFSGYGYITRKLESAGDENPYVEGARMTLYEGLELKPSGDKGDYTYEGLVIQRAMDQTVTRMYVQKGWAGTRTEFLPETREGTVIWTSRQVEREDTDILYYDLGGLDVFRHETADGRSTLYGYDRNHQKVPISLMEDDRRNLTKTDREFSVFAFKGGTPYLEIVGGDFTKISYSFMDKRFAGDFAELGRDLNGNYTFGKGAVLYHLDEDGNRDSLVDPDTGMAYILEEAQKEGRKNQRILVWPVKTARDVYGAVTARDKITTFRTATVEENQTEKLSEEYPESGYITGSWKAGKGEESHTSLTVRQNRKGQNLNGEPLLTENTGSLEKSVKPVLDNHGLVEYYEKSQGTYHEKTPLYDRDGDRVREKEQDLLSDYRQAAYRTEEQEKISHRYGEGYILENTWITGDKTPNDPFRTQVEEGQADILKRVPAGTYILEELDPPDGYIKGFPTGITVEETSDVQTAWMVDQTIKLMIGKADGSSRYTCRILNMQSKDNAGHWKVMGTATEGKGSYGQTQLPGAELALYKAEKGKKAEKTPVIRWTTKDRPFYVERISSGDYLLEETKTPEGFVTMEPISLVVESTGEVQTHLVYNDHTKTEIEKYSLEGSAKIPVNGAEFHLYEALTDGDGNVVVKDGAPQYKKETPIDTWKSSDAGEYENFMTAFEEMYRIYGTEGESVSWEDHGTNRTAERIWYTQTGPYTAGDRESHFPTSARLHYRTEDGKEIRITVYEQFAFEYQFDYHQLPKAGAHAVSYLTVEGMRRLDYLPAGKSYVLTEVQAPAGYAKAEDLVIHVEDTADIQRYGVLNQEGTLLISKTGKDGRQQLSGAWMALYRAAGDGSLIQEDTYLAAKWVSGSDGVYTELEEINGLIPEGYGKGDLRLHPLKKLPDGIYYLVELQAPDYYTLMEPVKIEYRQQEKIQIVRAVDSLAEGELEITKTDPEGRLLPGAVFQLTAWKEKEPETPLFTRTYSEEKGVVKITGLPVGEAEDDGTVLPYVYRLKEIIPPDGYKTGPAPYTFRFQPNRDGISYKAGETAQKQWKIINDRTKVVIQKKAFDFLGDSHMEGAFIQGAKLAVFKVTGRDEEQNYLYDESDPIEEWETLKNQPSKILEGLTAGQTYVLVEKEAPRGYGYMKPVFFTISMDGRKITGIGNSPVSILAHTWKGQDGSDEEESDSIDSVTIQGRYAIKTEMSVEDSHGKPIASWIAGGDGYLLPETEGVEEGEICTITETTIYSDGSRTVTGRTIKPLFWENGVCRIPDRRAEQVTLDLAWEDGTSMESFTPKEDASLWRIHNNLAPENPRIRMYNREGRPGSGLNPNQEVFNQITYVNTSNQKADLELTVTTGPGTKVIDSGGGREENGSWIYHLQGIEPMESGKLMLLTEVSPDCLESQVTAELKILPLGNPEKKAVRKTVKSLPVIQKNKLTIFQELTGSGQALYEEEESVFEIFLYGENGEELRGLYPYQGSRNGFLRSGDKISLKGNQYITIDPGTFNPVVRYKAARHEDGKSFTSWDTEGQADSLQGACAVFSRDVADTRERIRFIKGQRYVLKEITTYSDGAKLPGYQMEFVLNQEAAIDTLVPFDKRIQVNITKEDMGGEEVAGATLQIMDEQGQVLEQWISGTKPHVITAVLEEGVRYILHEELAPDGYGYSADIGFTVSKDGVTAQVVMTDRPTKVRIQKTDITGEKEIPGAAMQILDLSGTIIESWISTEAPHEITGKLTAGKEYILHEAYAPEGFGYGEDIRFLVPRDGKILQVSMKDRPTHVTVRKTDITGEKEVPGAWLKITGPDGIVVDQWESEEKPHDIVGKLEAGKTYTLHESHAPSGYAYASDISFTVSKDGTVDQVKMKDKVTYVSVRKTDITGEKEVPGAAMQVLDESGQVVDAWISDSGSHDIVGKLEAGKTYTLHEAYAPGGYSYSEDVPFTVSFDGTIDRVVMKDDVTKLEILKIDKSSGQPLAGARLRLLTREGQTVEEWISTQKPHPIYGKLTAGAEYQVQEISAPQGYTALAQNVLVSVPEDGRPVVITIENRKKPSRQPEEPQIPKQPETPEKPDIPEEPDTQEEPRIGRVLAFYKTRLSGNGKYSFAGFKKIRTPETGDKRNTNFILVCILALLSIIGMIGLGKKEKKNKRSRKTGLFLLCCAWTLTFPSKAKAETITQDSDAQITVTWEPFTENMEIPLQPAEIYEYNRQEYVLKSCQIVSVMTEEKLQDVKDTIVYEAVEQTDTLPAQAEIQVTDEDTGQTTKVTLPALDARFKNWRWMEGFEFPVTVQQYDAGLFYLGDLTVTAGEEQPFLEYGRELLSLIDVNQDFYSIESTRWTSQPWVGEDGFVYRQAVASGRKYVADCSVTYGGTALLPAVPANAWQAVYVKREAKEEKKQAEPVTADIWDQEERTDSQGAWIDTVIKVLCLTVGILLLLFLLIFLCFILFRRKKNCKKCTIEEEENIKNKQRWI